MDQHDLKEMVRARYGGIAQAANSVESCCAPAASCCGSVATDPDSKSRQMGYSDTELAAVPEGANLGLGCGNPQAIAALRPGEVVIDLGSGAGFDCFLAAGQVGPAGKVIGVDMTHEMLKKARVVFSCGLAIGPSRRNAQIVWVYVVRLRRRGIGCGSPQHRGRYTLRGNASNVGSAVLSTNICL